MPACVSSTNPGSWKHVCSSCRSAHSTSATHAKIISYGPILFTSAGSSAPWWATTAADAAYTCNDPCVCTRVPSGIGFLVNCSKWLAVFSVKLPCQHCWMAFERRNATHFTEKVQIVRRGFGLSCRRQERTLVDEVVWKYILLNIRKWNHVLEAKLKKKKNQNFQICRVF